MEQLIQFISNHLLLCAAFLAVLIVVVITELQGQKGKGNQVSPQGAVDLMNHQEAQVIDIRDKEQFKEGHILNAICASPDDFSQEKIKKFKDKPIILVCNRGIQAGSLAVNLKAQGYPRIYVLSGGMSEWQNSGLPVVKGK